MTVADIFSNYNQLKQYWCHKVFCKRYIDKILHLQLGCFFKSELCQQTN